MVDYKSKMKIKLYILSLFVAFSAHGRLETFNESEVRSWTNCDNNTIRGKLVKYDTNRDSIYISRTSAAPFWYPLNKLSADDVAFVKNEVANLNKVVLPKNLYDVTYWGNPKFEHFDPKYLVLDNPFTLDFEKLKRNIYPNSPGLGRFFKPNWDFDRLLKNNNITPCYPKSHGGRMPSIIEAKSWESLRRLLYYYGVHIEDINKLPWFFSTTDCRMIPHKVMGAYGINYRSGSYDFNRISKSIKNGIPVIMEVRLSYPGSVDGKRITFIAYKYNPKLSAVGFGHHYCVRPNGDHKHRVIKCYYLDIPRK